MTTTDPSAEYEGLRQKYRVERVDGRDRPGGDKANARYFVLDYVHDPYARVALGAYADACETSLPQLAADLRQELTGGWCDACGEPHACAHCHDDPPAGHTCPACGTTAEVSR